MFFVVQVKRQVADSKPSAVTSGCAQAKRSAAAAETVTALPPSRPPSLTLIVVDSALYSRIWPLCVEASTSAFPPVNLIVVVVPKAFASPVWFVTVGLVWLGDSAAPSNVRLFSPAYPVARLP